jgi:hypothetical protein
MSGTGNVLLVSRYGSLVGAVREALGSTSGVDPLVVVKRAEVVGPEMLGGIGLVLFHLGEGDPTDPVGRLLWLSSTMRRPVPVLVLDDVYEARRSLEFFRMGVADVLSRSHHLDRIGTLIDATSLGPRLDDSDSDFERAVARAAAQPRSPITFSDN